MLKGITTKKIVTISGLLLVLIMTSFPTNVDAYVNVKGYYRSNGTYVAPYVRSNPNGLKYDNYSYTPSQGLYNSTYGTRGTVWDTPTYITDPYYYEGKALYESGSSGYGVQSSSYSSYGNSYYSSNSSNTITNIYGGYRIGNTVICNTNFYTVGSSCVSAPLHSTAYGGTTFYCDTGYEKVGSNCTIKPSSSNSYRSNVYTSSNSNNSTKVVEPYKCQDGYSWYFDKCVKNYNNAKYNGSTYACNTGYYANAAGNQCVGIDTWCKEKFGITGRGENGNCYCNEGYSFDAVTNKCKSNY